MVRLRDLLLDLVQVDVGSGVVAVEDLGDLLEGWAVGFDVEEVDEDEFEGVPELEGRLAGCGLEDRGVSLQCRTT